MYQRLRRRLKEQKGFTLIELVVVVAILGILAVILTPRVMDAIANARSSASLANGKQIQTALARYAVDHDGFPVHAAGTLTDDMLHDDLLNYTGIEVTNIATVGTGSSISATDYTIVIHYSNPDKWVRITPTRVQVSDTSTFPA